MSLGPLLLDPVLVPKPWGGRRLGRLGGDLPEGLAVGERWEVADLPAAATTVDNPCSRVRGGTAAGLRLSELIAQDRHALLGGAHPRDGHFPLLVKTLDAREHLSVQVHPPPAYVERVPEVAYKTESWLVLDAEPGAVLYSGLRDGVTLAEVHAAAGSQRMEPLLRRVPARAGEVHHLPGGVVHALGAGVMVVEVQTPSDTTFRLYDWAQEYDRQRRELHLEEGLRALELAWEDNVGSGHRDPATPASAGGAALLEVEEYRLARYRLPDAAQHHSQGGRARILYVVAGQLAQPELPAPLHCGGVVLLPASWSGSFQARGSTVLLEVDVR